MATDYKLDSTGDLDLSSLGLVLLDTKEAALRQRLQIVLRTYQGEWFMNTTTGLPYFSDPFINKPDKVAVDNVIKTAIINTEGVVSLDEYTSSLNSNRDLNVSFSATSETGEIVSITDLEIT
jgi:phage baseplate assembly protein W